MLALKIPTRILAPLFLLAGSLLPASPRRPGRPAWAQQSPPQALYRTVQGQAKDQPVQAAANSAQTPADKVVISVGDEKITAGELDQILRAMPAQYRAYYGGPGRKLLPQYVVQIKILSAEALKRNLQASPETKTAIDLARESILANAAREQIEQSLPASNQQLEALYDSDKTQFEEARIRRILIRTTNAVLKSEKSPHPPLPPDEAQKKLEDLRKQILAGADFAQLARANSDDEATAAAGGDMGFINRQSALPPIAQAAFSLKPGEVSDVIFTPYGFELIKVEEKRTKPFAEVKDALATELRQSEFQNEYEELVKKYHVVVDTEFFTPPPAHPKPSPGPAH